MRIDRLFLLKTPCVKKANTHHEQLGKLNPETDTHPSASLNFGSRELCD
jgi:hypothetical protein